MNSFDKNLFETMKYTTPEVIIVPRLADPPVVSNTPTVKQTKGKFVPIRSTKSGPEYSLFGREGRHLNFENAKKRTHHFSMTRIEIDIWLILLT